MKIGDEVIVDAPGKNDLWSHSFTGTIEFISSAGIISVIDMDDDVYDVEEDQILAIVEE